MHASKAPNHREWECKMKGPATDYAHVYSLFGLGQGSVCDVSLHSRIG